MATYKVKMEDVPGEIRVIAFRYPGVTRRIADAYAFAAEKIGPEKALRLFTEYESKVRERCYGEEAMANLASRHEHLDWEALQTFVGSFDAGSFGELDAELDAITNQDYVFRPAAGKSGTSNLRFPDAVSHTIIGSTHRRRGRNGL